jgi:hypothetical protein
MLIISVPTFFLPALEGSGYGCKINGEDVVLRLVDGFLCYRGEGQDHRCKVLQRTPEGRAVRFIAASHGDAVRFIAASHGDENEPHVIIEA